MILYDEKLNFMGMSERSLNLLGYEDIDEFMSLNKDVADLFIKKDGYIHKFDNFSWIDFILYSGSKTKQAIVKLKNGDELIIDISIKEIFLQSKIDENKKLYSIKLISDDFQNISTTKTENITKPAGNFSLNNMLSAEDKIAEIQIAENKESNYKKPKQPAKDIKLNFLDMQKQNEPAAQSEPKPIDNTNNLDFKLDTEKDNQPLDFLQKQEIKKQPFTDLLKNLNSNNDIMKTEEPQPTEKKSDSLNLLDIIKDEGEPKDQEFNPTNEIQNSNLVKNIEKTNSNSLDFLNFSKSEDKTQDIEESNDSIKDQKNSELLQNIFKIDVNDEIDQHVDNKPPAILNHKVEENEHKLSFLNKKTIETNDAPKEEIKEASIPNQVQKLKIIKQIKKDIKEIDGTYEVKEQQPLVQEVGQIQNSSLKKDNITDPSFVSTLKSLFDENESQQITKNKDKLDVKNDQVFSFNLKKQDSKENEPDKPKELSKTTNKQKTLTHINKQKIYASLQSLGLNQEQEQELVIDFVEDSKESLESIRQFITVKDFDKIKYCLVKIKSSAEILNLDDIITLSNSLRSNCDSEDLETIVKNHGNLSRYIEHLENEILKDTV